jgi:hypothetical protein
LPYDTFLPTFRFLANIGDSSALQETDFDVLTGGKKRRKKLKSLSIILFATRLNNKALWERKEKYTVVVDLDNPSALAGPLPLPPA